MLSLIVPLKHFKSKPRKLPPKRTEMDEGAEDQLDGETQPDNSGDTQSDSIDGVVCDFCCGILAGGSGYHFLLWLSRRAPPRPIRFCSRIIAILSLRTGAALGLTAMPTE